MKFCWCTIMVDNLEESVKFYQDVVGLPFCRRLDPSPGVEIAFMCDDGETQIELIHNEANKEGCIGQGIFLAFEIDSVSEKMEELARLGIAIDSGPFRPNPYVKFFYILDPNGIKIQLVERFK